MSENISNVTDADFQAQVLDAQGPVLVDFWAEWCGPCRAVAPIVEEIANENADKCKFCKLDVQNNPNTPRQYGIMNIPSLVLFKDGMVAEKIVGYMPKANLWKRLEPHLK
ncbi:MAG: thioredoxin [Chloroflexota bacterium]